MKKRSSLEKVKKKSSPCMLAFSMLMKIKESIVPRLFNFAKGERRGKNHPMGKRLGSETGETRAYYTNVRLCN